MKKPLANETVWVGSLTDPELGQICLAVSERGLLSLYYPMDVVQFCDQVARSTGALPVVDAEKTALFTAQICEFLAGERRSFDLPIDQRLMTPYQINVLEITARIPYGETRSYGEVAAMAGNPRAARAVGRAQATNPIPLVIPCHRVIGSDGSMVGYGGRSGVGVKRRLLALEERYK